MPDKMTPSLKAAVVDHTAEAYARRVQTMVKGLKNLADEIEREAMRPAVRHSDKYDEKVSYGDAAHRVIHSLHWGIANLHYDGIVQAAADADYALRAEVEED